MLPDPLLAKSDTPADHFVIGLEVEVALLPEWFDAIKAIAADFARRMAVQEHPEVWRIRIEMPKAQKDAFNARLQADWDVFIGERRQQGRW
jgi:hypothetical protein